MKSELRFKDLCHYNIGRLNMYNLLGKSHGIDYKSLCCFRLLDIYLSWSLLDID